MSETTANEEHLRDLLYQAWGVIANAGMKVGSGWDSEHPEWVNAAERWREDWLATLSPAPRERHVRSVEQIEADQRRVRAEIAAGLAAALAMDES